ncbi:MAG TPA: homoserine O-succinyltransferase [Marinilabiliaceae bacterium]|nr:homoserine O-succinyltransferase [Marinilabiliaceae bacterium]
MPVNINDALPAKALLEAENVFVMSRSRAEAQDIRPLKILLLNLMPLKLVTESQLLRVLSNSPLQVEVELMMATSHEHRNTPQEHLLTFYKTFEDIKDRYFDGLIITGAPIEMLKFEEVNYWKELCAIMDWSKKHVTSTFHICWGAQAGLYHHYGINKYELPEKMFGIFPHNVLLPKEPLLRGFDDVFNAPHSRHTEVRESEIIAHKDLILLSSSPEAGAYLAISEDRRQIFVTGHSEYDPTTLNEEYWRDINKGMDIAVPKHYYPNNDPEKKPMVMWRSHAHLLFSNWLNYYVYQSTPYTLGGINS